MGKNFRKNTEEIKLFEVLQVDNYRTSSNANFTSFVARPLRCSW